MLALVLAATLQQDAVHDVAVYEDASYGVALPRPFDDWVFNSSAARGTATVIFYPGGGALRDQLWGALVLTTLDRAAPLRAIADSRVQTSWRPQLGASFAILARDSVDVLGLPAFRLLMRGSIDRVALDVEELIIARGGDLILLQFRYPGGARTDSIWAGYRRTLSGLRIRDAPLRPLTGTAEAAARWRALAASPWQLEAAEVLVVCEAPIAGVRVAARLDLVNDGPAPQDTVRLWLPEGAVLDSVVAGSSRLTPSGAARERRLGLGGFAPAGSRLRLLVAYRLTRFPALWLPLFQPPSDSTGAARRSGSPRLTLRFDLPDSLRAVAGGRITSEAVAAGRRRITWTADDEPEPRFRIGGFAPTRLSEGPPALLLWRRPGGGWDDTLAAAHLASELLAAWATYRRAFGPVPLALVNLVEAGEPATRGSYGLLLLGDDALVPGVLARELARTWWGGVVRLEGPLAPQLLDAIVSWSAGRVSGAAAARSGGAPLDSVAGVAGEPRLREALRTIASLGRGNWLSEDDVFAALGPHGADALRRTLR